MSVVQQRELKEAVSTRITLEPAEVTECARAVVFESLDCGGLGLLSTADGTGVPHATWMATFAATHEAVLVALTSADSKKVSNIKSNPAVEWLFSGGDYKHLVYLRGTADVVSDAKPLKGYWNMIGEKDRAYFLSYSSPGIGFSAIRTTVNSITLVIPDRKVTFDVDLSSFWNEESD